MAGSRAAAGLVGGLVVGLVIASGAVALAAIPDTGSGTITGCHERRTGLLRVIDAEAGQQCTRFETQLTWNQQGQAGPQGPQGPEGPAGPAAEIGDNSILARHLAGDAVLGGPGGVVTDESLTSADIAEGAVRSSEVADDTLTDADVANNALTGVSLADGAVGSDEIAGGAVTGTKLADGSVTPGKLAVSRVVTGSLGGLGVSVAAGDAVALDMFAPGVQPGDLVTVETPLGMAQGGVLVAAATAGNDQVHVQLYNASSSIVTVGNELLTARTIDVTP